MADANWVLDISAALDGQSQHTLAELDALTESLVGAGKRSDEFQAAMKLVSSQLDAAKVAATAANSALAQGQDHYAQLEREAIRASKALEKANTKSVVPVEIKRDADRTAAALAAYESTLRGLEGSSATATAAQQKLERQLKNVDKIAKHVDSRNQSTAQSIQRMSTVARLVPGPLGALSGSLADAAESVHILRSSFSSAIATILGLAVVTAVVAAVTTAVLVGAAAWSIYAASTASAARDAGLTREAFAALSEETAAAVGAFEDVAAATGLGDAELTNLTKSLRAAKVAAADMPAALRAAATAEAALGSGGASEFIQQIEAGEASVQSFANEVDAKFGGVVASKLRGLDAQGKRFSKLWAGLFSGINLEPVLDAVDTLVGMFDKGNPLAQAFALGVEKAFGVVADNAVDTAYAIEAWALSVAISAVKAYLFFQTYGDKIVNALTALGVSLGLAGTAWAVFNAGVIAGWAAAAASAVASAATIAAAWVVAALPALAVIAAVLAVGAVIYQLITYWDDVVDGLKLIWSDLWAWFKANSPIADFVRMGADLIAGLVQGITGAVGAVVSAVTGAVSSAIDAAKDVLGIASPSKVFAEIGDNTAQGYVQGIEAGTPEAQSSLARMASPVDAGANAPAEAAQAGAASPPTSGRSAAFDFQGATFVFHGVADAETATSRFSEMLTTLLEGDADSLAGAAV